MRDVIPLRPAIFLDRDGVINFERGYVHRIEDFDFIPGSIAAMLSLQAAAYKLVIITNQAGIGRGFYTELDYQRLTSYMVGVLNQAGVALDGIYHCPHHPEAKEELLRINCFCRKPEPGLLFQAAADLQIDLRSSIIIGDKLSDIEAGRAAGLSANILVRSGHSFTSEAEVLADACLKDLHEAAKWVTRMHSSS